MSANTTVRLRAAALWLAVLLALGASGVHALHGTATGAWLSFYLKQTPLCALENAGWRAPERTYFSPARHRTVDVLRCTPAAAPVLHGAPLLQSLVVVSDMGGVVQRIAPDGRLLWQRKLALPRGADVAGNDLYVMEGEVLHVLDLEDGHDIAQQKLFAPALAIRVTHDAVWLVHATEAKGTIVEYALAGHALVERRRYEPALSTDVRGLDVTEQALWVADTLGHRVVKIDRASGRVVAQASSYFPNSVRAVDGKVFVAEEHLNRVGVFTDTLERLPSGLGCVTVAGRRDTESARVVANATGTDGESRCRRRGGAGASDLFSPNDFAMAAGMSYVADTDNHRIVEFRDGKYWGELTGFNSPVDVLPIPQLRS